MTGGVILLIMWDGEKETGHREVGVGSGDCSEAAARPSVS